MTRREIKVDFISEPGSATRSRKRPSIPEREPEFIIDGWAYFAIDALDRPGPTTTGDAKLCPVGAEKECVGLVWEVGSCAAVQFERASHGWMLYLTIPKPVTGWEELRQQLLPLMPEIRHLWNKHREAP